MTIELMGLTDDPRGNIVKNRKVIISVGCFVALLVTGNFIYKNLALQGVGRNLADEALLALIKNDQKGFEEFINAGGNVHASLPVIDGHRFTIAQGLSYFDRPHFMKFLGQKKMTYVIQKPSNAFDIVSLSIPKNNPELLNELLTQNPETKFHYGDKGWTLMHMASAVCAHQLTSILHQKGGLNWNVKSKDGRTALTLAAENECLPILGYWKEQKADFNLKDGRGMSALTILKKKKSAALVAFVESFESRKVASAPAEVNFYRKRKIPKDQIVDHSALIEPDERPMDATETAEFSEFSD